MGKLPRGTVTFLFSDIEGSTRLLQELGDRYTEVLAEHRRVLREAFETHGGVEVDTQGDAFFVAFGCAQDALAAAVEGQRALEGGPIRVRMGLHTGEPVVTEEGYVGMDVHKGARIAAVAHGAQVVVSSRTRELSDGALTFTDLGRHRLRDLTEPERLYQLGEVEFPPLRSLNATNLPVQPAPLIGREDELGEVRELVWTGRLVTLTGVGGAGKTRLALQAAAELVDEFKDGVFWVSLSVLTDARLVAPTIGATLGAKGDLAAFIDEQRMLLLLDNLEQILDCALMLAELLRSCPNVKLLVTSRAPLRITGEQEYEVPLLPQHDAIALFNQRARQVSARFEPDANVAEICGRLDGLPLALELAAARTKLFSPQQILERLGSSLDLLTAGPRDLPKRQQTLRATIEWSRELLSETEKQLFAGLAVFAGSFDLEAAAEVCGADLDALAALMDQSLLRRTGEERFFMLETIREYADERLAASGSEEAQRRHAQYFLEVAEASEEALLGAEEAEWMARLRADHDNLRSALAWSLGGADLGLGVRLAGSLWRFWLMEGRWAEGRRWLDEALPLLGASMPGDVRGLVLTGASEFARFQGDFDRAVELKKENLELQRSLGRRGTVAAILSDLGDIARRRQQFERARRYDEEAIAIRRAIGDSSGIAHALHGAGETAMDEGRWQEAEAVMEEAVHRWLAIGTHAEPAATLHSLGELARRQHRLLDAIARYRQSLELGFDLGSPVLIAGNLEGLAAVAAERRDSNAAARIWGAAEALYEQSGSHYDYVEEHDRAVALAKEAVGEDAFSVAWAEGRKMSAEEAVRYGLAALQAESLTARVRR